MKMLSILFSLFEYLNNIVEKSYSFPDSWNTFGHQMEIFEDSSNSKVLPAFDDWTTLRRRVLSISRRPYCRFPWDLTIVHWTCTNGEPKFVGGDHFLRWFSYVQANTTYMQAARLSTVVVEENAIWNSGMIE